ncbi:MAG: TM2 domain-containing protein [Bacilli bacterium]|nr:TM2 domain-containing protein [Bacilli bacterium]
MAKFCAHCGTSLDEGTKFCQNCGSNCEAVSAKAPEAPQMNATMVNNPAPTVSMNSAAVPGKSRVVAGLLGLFFGSLGVHNFYLGRTGRAVAQLLITVLSCFLLSFISGIWGFIESILILCGNVQVDGNGNPLKD